MLARRPRRGEAPEPEGRDSATSGGPVVVSPDGHPALDVVPLGGLGEFGMNMMAFSSAGTSVLVDAGVMFPEPELPGVELIIPDLGYLAQLSPPLSALLLTHGHEDHIGAVAHVLPYVQGPVYGTALTLALLEPKLSEHGLKAADRLVIVRPGDIVTVGALRIEFLRVTHSIPDCVALAIHTPAGIVIHTGDFKIDQTPLDGEQMDFHRLAELGRQGVLALFGDSTNIERKGFTGSELEVVEAFEEIFTSTTGKVIVATFASSIHRMQILVDLAAQFGRKVAFVGHGAIENAAIAGRLGYLRLPPGLEIRDSEVRGHPAGDVLCIATGSQGEPLAALSRIAIDDHRHVKLGEGDTVVFSARAIPGNEKAIGRVMNHIARRGADLIHEGIKHVHVSGHGSEEELKLMISLVRPRHFVPIHGEYRQLARHAHVARRVTGGKTEVLLAENGDILRFDDRGGRIAGKATAGRVLIDGTRTGEVGDEVLRDRRHLAGDGLVVPVVAITQAGTLESRPEIITRGFVVDQKTDALLREAAASLGGIIEGASVEERTDYGLIKERIRVELQRFFRKRAGRRPLVLPVVMEI
jgi:ribonuclease J